MNNYAVTSFDQLSKLVSELGRRLVTKQNRIARLERKMAKAQHDAAKARTDLIRLNAKHDAYDLRHIAAPTYTYMLEHPEICKGKTYELGSGKAIIRTQNVGALHFRIDEAATIAEIKERFPSEFDKVVKTTYSIRKDLLKLDFPEILKQLETAFAEPSETLSIFPFNTNYVYRLPVAQVQAAARKLGLIK